MIVNHRARRLRVEAKARRKGQKRHKARADSTTETTQAVRRKSALKSARRARTLGPTATSEAKKAARKRKRDWRDKWPSAMIRLFMEKQMDFAHKYVARHGGRVTKSGIIERDSRGLLFGIKNQP